MAKEVPELEDHVDLQVCTSPTLMHCCGWVAGACNFSLLQFKDPDWRRVRVANSTCCKHPLALELVPSHIAVKQPKYCSPFQAWCKKLSVCNSYGWGLMAWGLELGGRGCILLLVHWLVRLICLLCRRIIKLPGVYSGWTANPANCQVT